MLYVTKKLFSVTATLCSVAVISACLPSDVKEGDTEGEIIPVADPQTTVCDPFANNDPIYSDKGIKGKLYYLTDEHPRFESVLDVVGYGVELEADLYFNRLNIPTRPWDRGFYTMAGELITNAEGETLYEYFGVKLNTQLQLSPDESAGYYQMAVLSDDGAIITIGEEGAQAVLVDNDGTHPTRMACATEAIYLDHNTKIPAQILYHQGPRYHISLMVMWRPWPTDESGLPVVDPHCGKSGNSYFFDSTQNPPQAKTPYYELLERNWKVLETVNYALPAQEPNPCVIEEAPLEISAVSLTNVSQSSVTVSWSTNLDSTSKVIYRNVSTGEVFETLVNQSLVKDHVMVISGLTSNTLYAFKAVSTTPGEQERISDEKAIRTLR